MTIEIEKGIPVPEKVRTRSGKYPWDSMEVGDSFKLDGRTKKVIVPARLKPKIFRQAAVEGGWRVWRTA